MHTPHQLYSEIEISTEVLGASRHKQIQMLLEKCMQQIQHSKSHMKDKNIQKKHKSISNALDIVNYLRACLNHTDPQARELAELLGALYSFLEKSLLKASVHNSADYLDQAEAVLKNIKEGWDGITE